jgi:hypothetical protein
MKTPSLTLFAALFSAVASSGYAAMPLVDEAAFACAPQSTTIPSSDEDKDKDKDKEGPKKD